MPNYTIYGEAGDGGILMSGDYASCVAGTNETTGDSVTTGNTRIYTKYQSSYNSGPKTYTVTLERSFLYFDLSGISADAEITSATLYLYLEDFSNTPGDASVYDGQPTYPTQSGDTPALEVGDFDKSNYSLIGATSGSHVVHTWFTRNIPAANANPGGITKFMLKAANECSTGAYRMIGFASGDDPSHKPYMEITTAVPTVTTQAAPPFPEGATLNGNITNDAGTITQHGFCWKAGSDPVNIAGADDYSELGAGSEGAFDQEKTGLTKKTLYYYRAYATSGEGTGYGDAVSFTTGEEVSGAANISTSTSVSVDDLRIRPGTISISSSSSLISSGGMVRDGCVAIDIKSVIMQATEGPFVKTGRCNMSSAPAVVLAANYIVTSASTDITSVASVIALGNGIFSSAAGINVTVSMVPDGDRVRYGTVTISSTSSISALGVAYVAQIMGYTGTLTAGDVLVIDCDEQTVELNGANATQYFTGVFPQLYSGTNELRYKDGGEVPDLDFETKHDPRYL